MTSSFKAKKPEFIRKRKILQRGEPNRRCLNTETIGGVETYYHATKGPRRRHEPEVGNNAAGDLYQGFIPS